jgi:predicted nucleic acid-binding protein
VRLLVDTNVFLELLLAQARADEAKNLLENRKAHELFLSNYAVHSIGLMLLRRKQPEMFRQFLADVATGMTMVSLALNELNEVIDVSASFGMDFDDAYQYVTAEKYGLTIVSFDPDFDRATRGRKTPAAVS